MQALRELFRSKPASFSGRSLLFERIRSSPDPPGAVGHHSGSAGTHPRRCRQTLGDGWIPNWVSPERFRDGLAGLPEHVVPALTVPAHVSHRWTLYGLPRRTHAEGFREHVVEHHSVTATLEQCAAHIRRYVEAARHIVFKTGEPEDAARWAEVPFAAAR